MAPVTGDAHASKRRIENVFDKWRSNAKVLRETGHEHDAILVEKVLNDISQADLVRSLLTWISESDAQLKSGFKADYFRSRFAGWEQQGFAEKRGRVRYYRALIVPQRIHASVVRSAAHHAARDEARS